MPIPKPFKADESTGLYAVDELLSQQAILKMANYLARQKLKKGEALNAPALTYAYLQTRLQTLEHEVFATIWLDQQHRVIKYEEVFRGTVNQASVYPRELVKSAMKRNAAAVILVHNHPSGNPKPSESDKAITQQIKQALALVEVRVLDHIVVGREGYVSLAESGHI